MKFQLFLFSVFIFSLTAKGQEGNEWVVYIVKGNVTVSYKNEIETVVKTGAVLHTGAILQLGKLSSAVVVCKQGKPISLTKEGTYSVNRWRDSCGISKPSVSSQYFKYVWLQLYQRSDEYKERQKKNSTLAVSRGEYDSTENEAAPKKLVLVDFAPGLDTLNYAGGSFPLSWQFDKYKGRYQFLLYTSKDRKLVHRQTVSESKVLLDEFSNKLHPGASYAWTITADGNTGVIRRRILNIVTEESIRVFIKKIETETDVKEDAAEKYFRMAYLLESRHYLVQAYDYYQKAVIADPQNELYSAVLDRFRKEFSL